MPGAEYSFLRSLLRHYTLKYSTGSYISYRRILCALCSKKKFVVPSFVLFSYLRNGFMSSMSPFPALKDDHEIEAKLPKRLQRFRGFASIEFEGMEYMSPQDFLDSLVLDEPKERVFRRVLKRDQLKKILRQTPPLRKGSDRMFRNLGENGIISYAEYLFLLTLLTKSRSSFDIAFTMFDDDDNMQIDKHEFLKIRSLLILSVRMTIEEDGEEVMPGVENTPQQWSRTQDELKALGISAANKLADVINLPPILEEKLEELMSHSTRLLSATQAHTQEAFSMTEKKRLDSEEKKETVGEDTTIVVHLFGHNGRNCLTFDQFQVFYSNLQKELIEIEFEEFARGKSEISSVDFARLVLRYSVLHKNDQSPYIRRIYDRCSADEGITLTQFEQFSMFLNNLEDFTKAVRLYTAADIPVSRSEFVRAVKCSTGFELDPHLVDTLYKIFDANGDDKLSYSEFIAIMNDRLHRGFRNYSGRHTTFGWHSFRDCVINELSMY